MIKVSELKRGNEVVFQYEIYTDGKGKYEKKIHLMSAGVKVDDFIYYILYDENFTPISEVFEFINYALKKQSVNTRLKALEALKFLYYFQEISGKKFEEFRLFDYSMLESFLMGKSSVGNQFEVNLITERSSETYNGYMSTYRKFAEFLRFDSTLLGAARKFYLLEVGKSVRKYYTSAKSRSALMREVPQYISVEEFASIIRIIRTDYTIREEIIIRLMFETGMRIGEVLGLTADDVKFEKSGEEYIGTVYIRNRASDHRDQYAKSCYKVASKRDYDLKEYKTLDCGYQVVFISQELYDLIDEYIEIAHIPAREYKQSRYYKSAIADRVEDTGDVEENYYIFINSQGGRLASSTWNLVLKEIMEEAGLILDSGKRENNLNHRFRHGFAMYNVQQLHLGPEELRISMRHRHIASIKPYLRYTHKDITRVKTHFTTNLYNKVPALREFSHYGEEK